MVGTRRRQKVVAQSIERKGFGRPFVLTRRRLEGSADFSEAVLYALECGFSNSTRYSWRFLTFKQTARWKFDVSDEFASFWLSSSAFETSVEA